MFSLPHVVPEFLLLGLMLIEVYGLNIPDSAVLSFPVKLSHMDMLKSHFIQVSTGHALFSFASILFLQKDKMCNMNVILEK